MPASGLARYLQQDLERQAAVPLGARRVFGEIGRLCGEYPENADLRPDQAGDLAIALARVRATRARHPAIEQGLVLELMILGKLGRFAEAVSAGRAAYSAAPGWGSATALANALRRSGDIAGALELFAAAAKHDPNDVTALLEIGDVHLENGRWASAIDAYQGALDREPGHAWAEPSRLYCQLRHTGRGEWRDRLKAMADARPDPCGAASVVAAIVGGYTADDARARAIQLLARLEGDGRGGTE